MRVIVFGAGAVGGLFGGRLALAGHEVLLVARPPIVAAVRSNGLVLEGMTEATVRVDATEALEPGARADWVLLTVKGRDVGAAGRILAGALARRTPIIALQNGLGIEETLRAALGAGGWEDASAWVLRGTHSYGATLVRPGVVRHAGSGELLLPRDDGALAHGTVERARELFASAGVAVHLVDDLPRELWRKALVNAAINPVTADHGLVNGALAKDPWRGQALRLLREAQAAARIAGFDFSDEEADRELFRVVRATAANRSSMLQDLDSGRPTEIEQISGYLASVAERAGVDLPYTRQAIARIHRRESEGRAPTA